MNEGSTLRRTIIMAQTLNDTNLCSQSELGPRSLISDANTKRYGAPVVSVSL